MTHPVIFDQIKKEIAEHDIVLYMKGTAQHPLCGFSMTVVQILQHLKVSFRDINVLEDPELRQGIKDFAAWPTIPQLYIKGEFVGGCDIIKEMYSQGELKALLKEKGITV